MDINSILKGVECSCGKMHSCNIEYVYIEKNAVLRMTEICKDYNNILIVADENTFSAAGNSVEKVLENKKINKVIFGGQRILIPDEDAIKTVDEQLADVELIIGIGSGVIQDLCKYVSFFSGIPYMVVATAPSMDGYASDGAAMILKGMKETVKAGLPKAIIADTEILKNAPMEMIKAGYGDIIGKYSALCDWKLSEAVNGEYFCQYIYDTTYDMIQSTLDTAKGLLERDEKSVKALMEALIVVGIMMSFAGSSRPASGSEHHLSHFFEIVGIINSEPYFPHGIDVAYSTVVTAEIRENILKKTFSDKLYRVSEDEYVGKMKEIYKNVADECIALQNRVGNYTAERINVYKKKEAEIREILAQMPKADEIKDMLSLAEIDVSEFYEMYGEKKIKDAVLYAKDLKDRYTVLWFNYDTGGGYKNE
ncbi:MAG: sn-glycerol-1-phosphate dehydrogenase [Clostridia bacterium]|nr:sn-glycerol-1-phosphate dehydrogenase [Clostridia bacterium]